MIRPRPRSHSHRSSPPFQFISRLRPSTRRRVASPQPAVPASEPVEFSRQWLSMGHALTDYCLTGHACICVFPLSTTRRIATPSRHGMLCFIQAHQPRLLIFVHQPSLLRQFRDAPIAEPSFRELQRWTRAVRNAITPETYHVKDPHITADDTNTAATILIFLVEWLFTHNVQGDSDAAQATFRNALFDKLRIRGRACSLTSLDRLLSRAKRLNIRV